MFGNGEADLVKSTFSAGVTPRTVGVDWDGLGNALFCAWGAEGALDWADGALLWAAAQPSRSTTAAVFISFPRTMAPRTSRVSAATPGGITAAGGRTSGTRAVAVPARSAATDTAGASRPANSSNRPVQQATPSTDDFLHLPAREARISTREAQL